MTIKSSRVAIWLLVSLQTIVGCKKQDAVQPQNKFLISSEGTISVTASELRSDLAGYNLSSLLIDDVVIYRITYKTTYHSQSIVASGLVILPETTDAIPMVSFQHGTITSNSEAPSVLPFNSTDLITYAALASPGFITVVPDYIGFGSSSGIQHPYYVEDLTASAVLDMLRAAGEFAKQSNINFNGKLFLAGYSQGGYATMAAHKAIEASPLTGFDLIASFPAAGGYDVKAMQEYFFGLTTYQDPFFIADVALAYKTEYADWTQPLSGFFNEPYAGEIPSLFNGINTGDQINAALTDSIPKLINANLLANINTDPQYQDIVSAFNANSLTDWRPAVRMYMYHGDADVTVPYSNSVTTYQKLIANGASTSVVTLTTLHGADHYTGVVPYITDFFPIMNSLK